MQQQLKPLWTELAQRAGTITSTRIIDLFRTEPDRLERMTLEAAGLSLDLSKQLLDRTTLARLLDVAEAAAIAPAAAAMFRGDIINRTEQRAVLHTALRAGRASSATVAGRAVADDVEAVLVRMEALVNDVHEGRWTGHSGARITDVVNIGIGGSHLGPQLACDALRYQSDPALRLHFLANVDGGEFDRVVAPLDPATTLFVVASKSFTTVETRLNALSARSWLAQRFPDPAAVARHFVAVSASPQRAVEFGVAAAHVYPLWDWVGGRYSLWSAVGLPIAFALGMPNFRALLAGAAAMDAHFRSAPLARNMPVMLALAALWNNNFLDSETSAVVPYDDRLRYLPDYLQQLEMESNGKRVDCANELLACHSATVTWGGLGTNAQHAFFQLLHQGTRLIPVDFIVCMTHPSARAAHHDLLVANCFAQAEGLMMGCSASVDNASPGIDQALHRSTPGDRPSSMLTMEALTPSTLGALIALYEHKTFVLSVIWNINAFDQWGVELGKSLTSTILQEFADGDVADRHDHSTTALVRRYLARRDR